MKRCSINSLYTRTQNKYKIFLKYYVQDFYDWDKKSNKPAGFVKNKEMYQLHKAGIAKAFEIEVYPQR